MSNISQGFCIITWSEGIDYIRVGFSETQSLKDHYVYWDSITFAEKTNFIIYALRGSNMSDCKNEFINNFKQHMIFNERLFSRSLLPNINTFFGKKNKEEVERSTNCVEFSMLHYDLEERMREKKLQEEKQRIVANKKNKKLMS